MIYPYKEYKITSPYGYRDLNGSRQFHSGIDLVGVGSKTVLSPISGIVGASQIVTDRNNRTWEWGNYVRIDNGNVSVYLCHLSKRLVSNGVRVAEGDPIGIEGNTGYSFGSHCHFEVRVNNVAENPMTFIEEEEEMTQEKFETMFAEMRKKLQDDDASAYSAEAREWAVANGIVKGNENGSGMWEDFLTREQMVTLLYRFAGLLGK